MKELNSGVLKLVTSKKQISKDVKIISENKSECFKLLSEEESLEDLQRSKRKDSPDNKILLESPLVSPAKTQSFRYLNKKENLILHPINSQNNVIRRSLCNRSISPNSKLHNSFLRDSSLINQTSNNLQLSSISKSRDSNISETKMLTPKAKKLLKANEFYKTSPCCKKVKAKIDDKNFEGKLGGQKLDDKDLTHICNFRMSLFVKLEMELNENQITDDGLSVFLYILIRDGMANKVSSLNLKNTKLTNVSLDLLEIYLKAGDNLLVDIDLRENGIKGKTSTSKAKEIEKNYGATILF